MLFYTKKIMKNFLPVVTLIVTASYADVALPQETNKTQKAKVDNENNNSTSTTIQKIKIGNDVINITLPKVPKAIQVSSEKYNAGKDRSIKFSKRVPPGYKAHSFEKKEKTLSAIKTGEVNNGKLSAYLRGKDISMKEVKTKLNDAGFQILASVPLNVSKDLISIVFTDESLLEMANKKNRGFIASLRVLVDSKNNTISITNPLYMAKGILQSDFDQDRANKVLTKILTQFTNLTNAKDSVKFQLLPKYQFMKGMPHYENMVEIASGPDLLEKLKNNPNIVFVQTLANKGTLVGVKLSSETRNFIKHIGRNNAAILPYPMLIENGKAKILDPKFYISFMYPLLSMSEFMTIANVPDEMIKDCKKVFQ